VRLNDLRGIPEGYYPTKIFKLKAKEIKKSKGPESDPQDRQQEDKHGI
jgi:hypothetical protein